MSSRLLSGSNRGNLRRGLNLAMGLLLVIGGLTVLPRNRMAGMLSLTGAGVIGFNSRPKRWHLALGQFNYSEQRYQEALAEFDRVLQLNPLSAEAYQWRGLTYLQLKDPDHALADFDQALQLQPELAMAHQGRGAIFWCRNELDLALQDFDWLVKSCSTATHVRQRGLIHQRSGDYWAAIEDFSQSLSMNPTQLDLYFQRGALRSYLGDFDGAIADFSMLIKQKPQAEEHYNRGVLFYHAERYAEAIEDLTRTLEVDPSNFTAYYCRGNAFYDLGEIQLALADYEQGLHLEVESHDPDPNTRDEHGLYGCGLARLRLGDLEAAQADLIKAKVVSEVHQNMPLISQIDQILKTLPG